MVSWRAEPTSLGVEQAPAQFIRRVAGAVRSAVHRAGVRWTFLVCAETRARGREGAQVDAPAGVRAGARSGGAQGPLARARAGAEAGMSTAEYAVGTIAACGFAALLFKIVTSAEVRSMLSALIQKALKLAG